MGSGVLTLNQLPGFLPQAASSLVAGVGIDGLTLSRIQMNADFGATGLEVFYQELTDGDTLDITKCQSLTTGYQPYATELINHWEYRSTVKDITGIPLAAGGLLILNAWIDPYTLAVQNTENYMVQGGTNTPTNDGRLAVWSFVQRGRGYLSGPGYAPAFSYVANSAFASSPALNQTLLQNMNDSAMAAASRKEVFIDAGQGTPWSAGYAVTAGYVVKPTAYRANGCYYTALINGTTGDTEPPWPSLQGSLFWDGSVLWDCNGRGFVNGQTFALPTSWDGHTYTAGEFVGGLCSWITTGNPNGTGPTGAGRIQRLQKGINSSRLVSTAVTYWDGNNVGATTDGNVSVIGFFQRAVAAQPSQPAAYQVMQGNEFMAGATVTSVLLEDLNTNINNAIARPTGFLESGVASGAAPTLPVDPVTLWNYTRSECMNVYALDDTGAVSGDMALRLFQTTLDPTSGLVTLRVDYNQGGGQITSANGLLDILTIAARDSYVLLDGVAILNLNGSPGIVPPGGGNIIPNGGLQVWNALLNAHSQVVAVPASWSISNSSQDGYNTQQPGNMGPYALGLDVGNAHAPADNQYVSDISNPAAITPGNLYSYDIWAKASPSISTGWRFRIHIRDINFANDVYFDVVALQGLGTSWTEFKGKLYMPQAGDIAVQTPTGAAFTLSAAAPADVTYLYAEVWNYEPNVSSTVIVGLVDIENQGGALDAVSPVNAAQQLTVNATLSQVGTSTVIDVAASALVTAYKTTNYGTGSVDPGSYGTWFIFADDPQLAGGSVIFQATANQSDLTAAPGRVDFGSILTIPAGGGSGGGGGGGGVTLTIQDTSLPNGTAGTPYSYALTAFGGIGPHTWFIIWGSLPSGLSLNYTTGTIDGGSPSLSGDYLFTVKATDSSSPANTATQPLILTVN